MVLYRKVTEQDVEQYLVRQIAKMGGRAIKFNPHNNRGLPDRICFIPGGVVIMVELKRPGQRPRKNQERQLEWFRKLGFQALWCDSYKQVDKLIRWIKQYKKDYKMVCNITHLCYRKDCPMRRDKR